jgi:ComF family protein
MTCGEAVVDADEPLVCAVCRMRWRPVVPPWCERCGEPVTLGVACRLCTDWPAGFEPVRSAVRFDPQVRLLLHGLKYDGRRRLAEVMAAPVAGLLRHAPRAPLVPIPLGRRRQRHRGYNQAEELARAIARRAGAQCDSGRLFRARETPTQTRLAPADRKANLASAFAARVSTAPAWLVDDVFTTGATLCSAASALLDAGAPWVGAVTFARAERPLAEAAGHLTV